MAARKLWETRWPMIPGSAPRKHESKAAVYRHVENEVRNWLAGSLRSSKVNVYVDERDGRGFVLYERVDLAELAKRDGA